MAGKHSQNPWRELGPIRGLIALLLLPVSGVVRLFRGGPEWLVGLVITLLAVAVFLVLAR